MSDIVPAEAMQVLRDMRKVLTSQNRSAQEMTAELTKLRGRLKGIKTPKKTPLDQFSVEARMISKLCRDPEHKQIVDELGRNPKAYFGEPKPKENKPSSIWPKVVGYLKGQARFHD